MKKDRFNLLSYVALLMLMGLDMAFLGGRYAHHRSPVAALIAMIVLAAVLAVHPESHDR